MPIYQLGHLIPKVAATAWLAPSANVIGESIIETHANIWFGAVLRADIAPIHIGEGSNIQDGCVLHGDENTPLVVEPYVTVGHQATLHSCHIGSGTLIGMQAVLLSRSRIGRDSIVAAGSLVAEGKEFPDGVLIMGSPAKVVRNLTQDEISYINQLAHQYVKKSQQYALELKEINV